jgi:lipopolysaccharide transport system permease protein
MIVTDPTKISLAPRGSLRDYWRELWRYRDLVYNLVVRDLKVRYRHSVLGILWSLLNPLLMMLVFTLVFTVLMPAHAIPNFAVFVLSGLLPWNFFQGAVMGAASQVIGSGHLIKKVYFPREVLPLSSVLSNLVNFALGMIPLFLFLMISGIGITRHIVWLPLILLIQVIFTLGLGFFLSTFSVFYRDTLMVLDVLLLGWFFLTPIFYPMEMVQQTASVLGFDFPVHRLLHWLNPMASIIDAYHTVLYGDATGGPPGPLALDFIFRTGVTALLVLIAGWWYFRRHSHQFGEEV